MSSYVLFLILGLGAGATYAILGTGLVLKYRSDRIVDFAHGALAMWIAYVFVDLRTDGTLPLPLIVIPHQITLSSAGIDTTLAIVISLVYAALLGAILYLAVYRPLRSAAPLTRICASVGVMLAFQAIAVLNFGTQSKTTPAILPSTPVTISGLSFPSDRIFFTGIVLVLALKPVLTVSVMSLVSPCSAARWTASTPRANLSITRRSKGASVGTIGRLGSSLILSGDSIVKPKLPLKVCANRQLSA